MRKFANVLTLIDYWRGASHALSNYSHANSIRNFKYVVLDQQK